MKAIVDGYKKKYYDARHCCHAYVLGPEKTIFRANDDGEPSSTAGKPILGQIYSHDLCDILICVIRYYGGVNLGTGGLITAYRSAASDAIDHSHIEVRTVEEQVDYRFPYSLMNAVMKVVKDMNARIVAQDFDNTCEIKLAIAKSMADRLRQRLQHLNYE